MLILLDLAEAHSCAKIIRLLVSTVFHCLFHNLYIL